MYPTTVINSIYLDFSADLWYNIIIKSSYTGGSVWNRNTTGNMT